LSEAPIQELTWPVSRALFEHWITFETYVLKSLPFMEPRTCTDLNKHKMRLQLSL